MVCRAAEQAADQSAGEGQISQQLIERMEGTLREELEADRVAVTDIYGDGRHVSIDVVSKLFDGQTSVKRQRMVYKVSFLHVCKLHCSTCNCRPISSGTELQLGAVSCMDVETLQQADKGHCKVRLQCTVDIISPPPFPPHTTPQGHTHCGIISWNTSSLEADAACPSPSKGRTHQEPVARQHQMQGANAKLAAKLARGVGT